jgi:hypothetical protein
MVWYKRGRKTAPKSKNNVSADIILTFRDKKIKGKSGKGEGN